MKLKVETVFGLGDEFYYAYLSSIQLNHEDHFIWRVGEPEFVTKINVTFEDRTVLITYNNNIPEKLCFHSKDEAIYFCEERNNE